MLDIDNEQVLAGFKRARERRVTLRANTLKASAGSISETLDRAKIAYERVPWYEDAFVLTEACENDVRKLDIYQNGSVYLQSLSSMLPPLVLRPQAGADVLDMCAAPGGKTSQIAALTGNAAHLTACEMSTPRAEKLAYNLDKLGVSNINIMRTDARRLDEFFSFDQILLDAPCTGIGTLRAGDEKVEGRITPQLLAKVTKSQKALLDRALSVLKPGGTLVYSTCSVLEQENETQVRCALKRHSTCEIVPLVLGEAPMDDTTDDTKPAPIALADADEGPLAIPILDNTMPGTLTVAPTEFYEGFFVAVIRKKERSARKHRH